MTPDVARALGRVRWGHCDRFLCLLLRTTVLIALNFFSYVFSGGLYIVSAVQGTAKSAMVASWVAQASFEPLGFTVAIAKDRAIESLMQVGDRFVLNCLPESGFEPVMKVLWDLCRLSRASFSDNDHGLKVFQKVQNLFTMLDQSIIN